jgi:hypothetical protein
LSRALTAQDPGIAPWKECPTTPRPPLPPPALLAPPAAPPGLGPGRAADMPPPGDGQPDFRLDPLVQGLNPPLSDAELEDLEDLLVAEGCRDALVVWEEERVLLDGYNRYRICQRRGLPFSTRQVSLPDREAARAWVLKHQSGRRNLTPEGLSYLRGKRFEMEKGRPGGTGATGHAREQLCQNDIAAPNTSDRLAAEFKVSPRTITRDARFAQAVDVLAELEEGVKKLILSRDARLKRGDVERIARLGLEERRRIFRHLLETGEVLRPWRAGGKAKLVLPADPEQFVRSLMRKLSRSEVSELSERLVAALKEPETAPAGPEEQPRRRRRPRGTD